MLACTFCALCKKRICNENNSLLCISCSESFHKKYLRETPETFNKFHVSKNFLYVDCAFKNPLFYQSSDSSDCSLKIFFKTMIWLPSLNWSHFLSNDSYKLMKMNCKLLTPVQAISSQFSLLNALLWNVVQLLNHLI